MSLDFLENSFQIMYIIVAIMWCDSLNVLCIYPGMVKEKIDNAFVLVKLKEKGVNVMVITGKSLGLKGKGNLLEYEDMCGVPVHRVFRNIWWAFAFPGLGFKKKLELVEQFHPDLIFCSLELNIRFATMLQKQLK